MFSSVRPAWGKSGNAVAYALVLFHIDRGACHTAKDTQEVVTSKANIDHLLGLMDGQGNVNASGNDG